MKQQKIMGRYPVIGKKYVHSHTARISYESAFYHFLLLKKRKKVKITFSFYRTFITENSAAILLSCLAKFIYLCVIPFW